MENNKPKDLMDWTSVITQIAVGVQQNQQMCASFRETSRQLAASTLEMQDNQRQSNHKFACLMHDNHQLRATQMKTNFVVATGFQQVNSKFRRIDDEIAGMHEKIGALQQSNKKTCVNKEGVQRFPRLSYSSTKYCRSKSGKRVLMRSWTTLHLMSSRRLPSKKFYVLKSKDKMKSHSQPRSGSPYTPRRCFPRTLLPTTSFPRENGTDGSEGMDNSLAERLDGQANHSLSDSDLALVDFQQEMSNLNMDSFVGTRKFRTQQTPVADIPLTNLEMENPKETENSINAILNWSSSSHSMSHSAVLGTACLTSSFSSFAGDELSILSPLAPDTVPGSPAPGTPLPETPPFADGLTSPSSERKQKRRIEEEEDNNGFALFAVSRKGRMPPRKQINSNNDKALLFANPLSFCSPCFF